MRWKREGKKKNGGGGPKWGEVAIVSYSWAIPLKFAVRPPIKFI